MLDSHMQHTVDQFAYVQGQITALSSQIDDISINHDSNSEGGENFEGGAYTVLGGA